MTSEPPHDTTKDSPDDPSDNPWDSITVPEEQPVLATPTEGPTVPPLNGWDYLCWAVIIGVTLFITVTTAVSQFSAHEPRGTTPADLMQINLQAKVLVGTESLQKNSSAQTAPASLNSTDNTQTANDESLKTSIADTETKEFNSTIDKSPKKSSEKTPNHSPKKAIPVPQALDAGPYEQRLCYAVLLSELFGPQRAQKYFVELDQKVADVGFEPDDGQLELRESVESLIGDYAVGNFSQANLSEEQKTTIRARLGYSGQLLLTPAESQDIAGRKWVEQKGSTTVLTMFFMAVFAVLFFFVGVIAACVILGQVFTGASPPRFNPHNSRGSLYLQTFAIWIVLFFGAQLAVPLMISAAGFELTAKSSIFLSVAIFFLSLLVLAWPVSRGLSWAEVARDIGWTQDPFVKNVVLGILTYAAWLPMIVVGFFMVFVGVLLSPMGVQTGEFETPATPGHPVQEFAAAGDNMVWVGVLVALCVAAPIVEETMFRGVLYRYLRERSGAWQRWISVLVAAVINGLIFASIHPQGILAVPLLTILAIGFSLAREWRDSLVSSMTMHAVNNAMAATMMFTLF